MNNDSDIDDESGLSAFDDLEPISAVSELSALPGQPGALQGPATTEQAPPSWQQGIPSAQPSSTPPPVPNSQPVARNAPHSPTMDGTAGMGNGGLATQHFDLPGPDQVGDEDKTMQFSIADLERAVAMADEPEEQGQAGLESPGFDRPGLQAQGEPAVQVAADISMEWDDDESETRIHQGLEHPGLAAMPPTASGEFGPPAAPQVVPGGAPSPFPPAPTPGLGIPQAAAYSGDALPPPPKAPGIGLSQPPVSAQVPAQVPAQAPAQVPAQNALETLIDEPVQDGRFSSRVTLLLAVASLCAGAVWAAFNLFSSSEATITLATTPSDAEVTLDGEPLAGQTSPYVLSVVADEEHQLVVRKDGYEPYETTLKAKAGENRALPQIELQAVHKEMGFSIDSNPPGARVLVDGKDTGKVTPARVVGVSTGTHAVKLLSAEGHRPFEIQVFVPDNNVVALPKAELEWSGRAAGQQTNKPVGARAPARVKPESQAPIASRDVRRERRARRSAGGFGGGATGSNRSSPFGAPKPRPKAKASAAAGGGGTLRLNSRPWAQIAVDGRPVGNTPQLNLKVPAGAHTVKFSNPQLGLAKTIKVHVRKNQTVTKVVNLIE